MAGIALPAYGFEELIEIGKESTYGTVAAVSRAIAPASEGGFDVRVDDPAMPMHQMPGSPVGFDAGDATGTPHPREFKEPVKVGGPFNFIYDFNATPMILLNALGGSDTHTSPAAEQHVMSLPADLASSPGNIMPSSLSMLRQYGAGKWTYGGIMVDVLTLQFRAGKLATIRAELVGQHGTHSDTPNPTLSLPVSAAITLDQLAVEMELGTVGGSSLTAKTNIQTLDLVIRNNLRRIPSNALNGNYIREPVYDGDPPRQVTLQFTTDHEDSEWIDLWLAAAGGGSLTGWATLQITMDSGVQIGATGVNFQSVIDIPAFRFLGDYPGHPGSRTVIPETVRGEAASVTTAGGKKILDWTTQNDVASAY